MGGIEGEDMGSIRRNRDQMSGSPGDCRVCWQIGFGGGAEAEKKESDSWLLVCIKGGACNTKIKLCRLILCKDQ